MQAPGSGAQELRWRGIILAIFQGHMSKPRLYPPTYNPGVAARAATEHRGDEATPGPRAGELQGQRFGG
jgi:hypothetical protein